MGSLNDSDRDALELESLRAQIPIARLAWAEFTDGSIRLVEISGDDAGLASTVYDPLPKHYRDIELPKKV